MLKTKVMECLHDWIVVSKRIVRKYTIEALNVDRNALKKKCRFSVFTRHRWNAAAKRVQKFHGWNAQSTQVLNSYRLEDVVLLKINVFDRFPLSSLLRNQTRLSCSHSNVPIGQCTTRDIPNQRLTILILFPTVVFWFMLMDFIAFCNNHLFVFIYLFV